MKTNTHTKLRAFATTLGIGVMFGLGHGQTVIEVAGDSAIGDQVLTTDGGTATLDGRIGLNWQAFGGNGNAFSGIVSPAMTVPETGPVTLRFTHRYNFESDYDGGAVYVSVNGGPAAYLEPTAFSANGYVGIVNTTVWSASEEVFHGQSTDFGVPSLIESVADLGSLNAGDTVSVEFRGGWDANTFPAGVNWEIGSVTLEDTTSSAFLDVDFTADGPNGFTASTTPGFNGGWQYPPTRHVFELDADTPDNDRYAPDVAGSEIDLNDAAFVVELESGTLEAGDEFTLFDLSGGTTLSGDITSLTLPLGVWDTSSLAADGRIILLLADDSAVTPGFDFFVEAGSDADGDSFWEDLTQGNPTGFDLFIRDGSRVATTRTTQLSHAYDFPGGATGNNGGAGVHAAGSSTAQRSFQQAPGDWSDDESVSIEVWVKPDTLDPGASFGGAAENGMIIFEDGGGTGLGILIDDNAVELRRANANAETAYDLLNDPQDLVPGDPTSEFIQITGTYDFGTGDLELFVNGKSTGAPVVSGGDWSGGDAAAFGGKGDNNVGGVGGGDAGCVSFDGQIALVRMYRDQVLTEAEIEANYLEVSSPDTTAPAYTGLSPANLTPDFFAGYNLVATFTEAVALTGTGSVTLRDLDTPNDTVISLPDPRVSVSGNQLIIDPAGPLEYATDYAVLISPDAIEDLAPVPNAFAGITDPTRWTFTTEPEDFDAPVITSLSPEDDAAEAPLDPGFVITFDEIVELGTGNITVKNLTESFEFDIDVTDGSGVTLTDNVLTIDPAFTLEKGDDYAIRIDSGAVRDRTGNDFAGIDDDTTWNFTVENPPDVLFADNFDRSDSSDLNASTDGKSGALGALEWSSGNTQSTVDINDNALRTNNDDSDGSDGGWAWVDHNFTGLGEFTVSVDLSQNSGGDGRVAGIRIGQALTDLENQINGSTGDSSADVAVYYDNIGGSRGLRIFEGADELDFAFPNAAGGFDNLSVTFTFADMNAGTALDYEVFFNGESVMSDSTTWSGTDENYISLQSNSTGNTFFDNFSVSGTTPAGGGFPPGIVALTPPDESINHPTEEPVIARFGESVRLSDGSVTIKNLTAGTEVTIPASDTSQISLLPSPVTGGTDLVISPTGGWADGSDYAMLLNPGVVEDLDSPANDFAGLTADTDWNFSTLPFDDVNPTIAALEPADDGSYTSESSDLRITFDEIGIKLGTGSVTLKNLTDGTETVIDVTDASRVSVSGATLIIDPVGDLGGGKDYAVQIDDTAVLDLSGNPFAGITDDETWNFQATVFGRFDLGTTGSDVADGYEAVTVGVNSDSLTEVSGSQNGVTVTVFANTVLDSRDRGVNALHDNETVNPDGSLSPLLRDWLFDNGNSEGETMTVEFTGLEANTNYKITSVHFETSGGQKTFVTNWYQDSIAPANLLGTWNGDRDAIVAETDFVELIAGSDGTGTITLVAEADTGQLRLNGFIVERGPKSDYQNWADLYPDADLGDPSGDFDGDGMSNDDERLFGLDPTDGASVNPITVPLDTTTGTLSFTRRDNALTGLFADVETSFDLVTWTVDSGAVLTEGTPDGNHIEVVDVTLSPGLLTSDRLFVRVNQNDDGTLFAEDFESSDGGFSAVGTPNDWAWGTPGSDNNFGLAITAGNGGSANCWGTNLGEGGAPSGLITTGVDSILRSPDIDLTGVAGAELNFAAAIDANSGDVVEVLVREAGTDALLASILPLGESPLGSVQAIDWSSYGPFDLSFGVGSTIYLEFRYVGQDDTFIGLYIDDVSVTELIPAP